MLPKHSIDTFLHVRWHDDGVVDVDDVGIFSSYVFRTITIIPQNRMLIVLECVGQTNIKNIDKLSFNFLIQMLYSFVRMTFLPAVHKVVG